MYEVVFFTASTEEYAREIINRLDKDKKGFEFLSRKHWKLQRLNQYVKDLGKLGRDLKSVIIIDNTPIAYSMHKENAIPISSWYSDINDKELLRLLPLLKSLATVDDVRKSIPALLLTRNKPEIPKRLTASYSVKHRSIKIDSDIKL